MGSAWTGQGPQPQESSSANTGKSQFQPKFSNQLMELARKMRMNTDARRDIFCAMMSSEDYLEATERLLKLDLNRIQVWSLSPFNYKENHLYHWNSSSANDKKYCILDWFQHKHREIIFVVLACCLKEKAAFNPFYSQLTEKLCSVDRKYRISAQYAIWDRVKELPELKQHESRNLSLYVAR